MTTLTRREREKTDWRFFWIWPYSIREELLICNVNYDRNEVGENDGNANDDDDDEDDYGKVNDDHNKDNNANNDDNDDNALDDHNVASNR